MKNAVCTWYLVQPKCPGCGEKHEYGPYPCREEAVKHGERMAENTDQLLSELTVEKRAPLTNDEIAQLITDTCTVNMNMFAMNAILAQKLGMVENMPDTRSECIATVIATLIETFEDFCPGSTVNDIKTVFAGYDEDTIGKVDGHA